MINYHFFPLLCENAKEATLVGFEIFYFITTIYIIIFIFQVVVFFFTFLIRPDLQMRHKPP